MKDEIIQVDMAVAVESVLNMLDHSMKMKTLKVRRQFL